MERNRSRIKYGLMVAALTTGGFLMTTANWAVAANQPEATAVVQEKAPSDTASVSQQTTPQHDHAAMTGQQTTESAAAQPASPSMGGANGMMGGNRGPDMMGGNPGPGRMGGNYGPGRMGGNYGPGYPNMRGGFNGPGYPGMMAGPNGPNQMNGPQGPNPAQHKKCKMCLEKKADGPQQMCKMCLEKKANGQQQTCKMCGQHKMGTPQGAGMASGADKSCTLCNQKNSGPMPMPMPMGMQNMDPVMLGYHPAMAEQALSFLKTALAVTPAQETAWKGYTDAAVALANAHGGMVQAMYAPKESALAMAESRTQFVSQLVDKRKVALAAFKELFTQLTDEQKTTANRFFGSMAQ